MVNHECDMLMHGQPITKGHSEVVCISQYPVDLTGLVAGLRLICKRLCEWAQITGNSYRYCCTNCKKFVLVHLLPSAYEVHTLYDGILPQDFNLGQIYCQVASLHEFPVMSPFSVHSLLFFFLPSRLSSGWSVGFTSHPGASSQYLHLLFSH